MIELFTLLMPVCTAHPPVDDTSVSRQPRLVARTGSEPESGKRRGRAAHLITVHTGKHALCTVHAPCTVSRSFERGCTLLPCSICVSARIHHHQVKPGTPSSKTRLTIYSSDVWHCALSQAKNALNTTLCVWVMSVCPRGNEVIIRVKFWAGGSQPAQTLSLQFQSISECAKTLKPSEFMFAKLCWVYMAV